MRILFLMPFALGLSAPALAADRNYSVSGFDRIRVDGPFRVELTTGVAPFARASGSLGAIDGVSITVQGRTLIVRSNPSAWGGYPGQAAGPVAISVGTHELSAAWLNGSGALAIDRLKGLSADLSVQGSGALSVTKVEVDQLKIGLSGAGSATLAGNAANLSAVVRGTSTLDAGGLSVKDAKLGSEGPSTVRLKVANSAKIDASGVASVEVSGGPACTVRTQGSAVVSGCS